MPAAYTIDALAGSVEFGKGGPRLKDSAGTIEIRNNADTAYANLAANDLTLSNGLTLNSASPAITIGDETGSPTIELKKADAGSVSLFFSTPSGTGSAQWDVFYDSSENWLLRRFDNTGAFVENTIVVDPNGDIRFANDFTLDSATPIARFGDATGTPTLRLAKVTTENGLLHWATATTGDTANDKRYRHGSDEQLYLENYNGASWDTALTIDNNADVIFANDLTLDSASPVATFGDGTGNPDVVIDAGSAGVGDVVFQRQSVEKWRIRHETTDNLSITRTGHGGVVRIDDLEVVSDIVGEANLTLDSPSPLLTVGDGTATFANIQINALGNSQFKFLQGGTSEVVWQVGSSGDLQTIVDASGTLKNTFYRKTTGNWEMPATLTLNSASPTALLGDASGSPELRLAKGAAGTTFLRLATATTGDTASDKRFLHNTSEHWVVQHYNGATWDTALTVDNSVDVLVANDLNLTNIDPVLTLGAGTGNPTAAFDKGAASSSVINFLLTGGSVNSKRLVHGGDETLKIEHWSGTWDTVLTVDNGADVQITNDLSVGGNLSLNSASPVLFTGDGNGSPAQLIWKSVGGSGLTRWGTGSNDTTNDKRFLHGTDETGKFQHYNGASWDTALTIDNSADVIVASDLKLSSASPTLSIGNNTGSPVLALDIDTLGAGAIRFRVEGSTQWGLNVDASDNFSFQRAGSAVVWNANQSTGLFTIANDFFLSAASSTVTQGVGSGSLTYTFDKDGTGTATIQFAFDGAVAANAKRVLHDTDETLTLEHFNGASWDVALTIDNNANVLVANDLRLADYLFQTENGTAPTTVDGEGATYVRDDAPTTLVFVDDAGGEHPLSLMQILNGSPKDAFVPGSAAATLQEGSSGEAGRAFLQYSASATNSSYWRFVMPRDYTGDGVTVRVHYFGSSNFGATDTVVWSVGFERHVNGLVTSSTSFGNFTNNNDDPGAINLSVLTSVDLAVASGDMDGVLAGESFMVTVDRLGGDGSDDYTGTAGVLGMELLQAA